MDRLYNAIGLAMRAGRLKSGAYAVQSTVRAGKAKLVLLEEGASASTKETYERLCAAHGVPLYLVETVGRAIGKEAHIVCAVTDAAFQTMIEGCLPNTEQKRG